MPAAVLIRHKSKGCGSRGSGAQCCLFRHSSCHPLSAAACCACPQLRGAYHGANAHGMSLSVCQPAQALDTPAVILLERPHCWDRRSFIKLIWTCLTCCLHTASVECLLLVCWLCLMLVLVLCAGETTAVGEPLPGPEGRIVAAAGPGWQQQQVRQAGAGSVLMNSLAVGFGVGLVFAVIRLVF